MRHNQSKHADVCTLIESILTTIPGDTEADVRARVIDRLMEALGWPHESVAREPYFGWGENSGFTDYVLAVDGRSYFVVEAKKSGRTFGIPEVFKNKGSTTLGRLMTAASSDLKEALEQCCKYAEHCGATICCATNGSDYVFFRPTLPGRARSDAKCVIFCGADGVLARIDEFLKLFDFDMVSRGSADKILSARELSQPRFARKLSKEIPRHYSPDIETEDFSRAIDTIMEDYMVDIADDEVFRRCYVPVGWAKSTDDQLEAMLANQISKVEAARLVDSNGTAPLFDGIPLPTKAPTRPKGRLVLIHGPVGIGKTSYIRHFAMRVDHKSKIWISIDLLTNKDIAFSKESENDILKRICKEISEAVAGATTRLESRADVWEFKHLRDIYNTEARNFQKAKYPISDDRDPVYLQALRDYLWELAREDVHEHLIRTLHWLTDKLGIPVIVVLDNSDQLGLEYQSFLFGLGRSIEKKTSTVVLLTLRTEALLSHKLRNHSIADVPERFEVERAPLIDVITRRLSYAESRIKERSSSSDDQNLQVALDRLLVLLSTLRRDFNENGLSSRIINYVGNGSLRRSLEAISHVFRSKPGVMDKLVFDDATNGKTSIEPRVVFQAVLNAGKGFYQSDSPACLVPNIYSGDAGVYTPPTLVCRLLLHIDAITAADQEAPTVDSVISAFGLAGLDEEIILRRLMWMHRTSLLYVPRLTDKIESDDRIKLTQMGEGLIQELCNLDCYIDATLWDSLIYERDTFERLLDVWRFKKSGNVHTELRCIFRDYLDQCDAEFQNEFDTQHLAGQAASRLPIQK